jgi:hypothetical protein
LGRNGWLRSFDLHPSLVNNAYRLTVGTVLERVDHAIFLKAKLIPASADKRNAKFGLVPTSADLAARSLYFWLRHAFDSGHDPNVRLGYS